MIRRSSICLAAAFAVAGLPAAGDVHLVRRGNGSPMIFNDVGSGWRVDGRAPSDAYLIARKDARTPFDAAIQEHAVRRGIDAFLVKCVILVESNFNPAAISRKGARGLMQLMPFTAHRYGVKNVHDAAENIRGGVAYLSDLLMTYHGDVPLALAAYNAGEGAVQKHGGVPPYRETQEYVRRAMLVYRGSQAPSLGGGFRRLAADAHAISAVRSAPVRLGLEDGAPVISNAAEGRRFLPVLGRVGMGDSRRTR